MKKKTPAGRPESGSAAPEADGRIRLNKYLALNGIASRRKADQLITEGEVMVDGEIVTELGTRIDPVSQRVEVDGVVLRPEGERHRYSLLNKPAGVVCTNDPRETRTRVCDLVDPMVPHRVFTVGRLDEDSEGLLLLTNDGGLKRRLELPATGWTRRYRVRVFGRVDEGRLAALAEGVRFGGLDYGHRFHGEPLSFNHFRGESSNQLGIQFTSRQRAASAFLIQFSFLALQLAV